MRGNLLFGIRLERKRSEQPKPTQVGAPSPVPPTKADEASAQKFVCNPRGDGNEGRPHNILIWDNLLLLGFGTQSMHEPMWLPRGTPSLR